MDIRPFKLPPISDKERIFIEVFDGTNLHYALRTAGYTGADTYLTALGEKLLDNPKIQNAFQLKEEKQFKRNSAIISKVERMEFLSAIIRNSDPYARPVKDEFGNESEAPAPTLPERLKASDMLSKMEGEYNSTVHHKVTHTLPDLILKSYQPSIEDDLSLDAIEAEYLISKEEPTPTKPQTSATSSSELLC